MKAYIYENKIFNNYLNNDIHSVNTLLLQNRELINSEFGIEVSKRSKTEVTFSKDLEESDSERFYILIESFELDMNDHNFIYEIKLFLFKLKTEISQKIFFRDIITMCTDSLGLLEYYISEFNEIEILHIQKETFSIKYNNIRFQLLSLLRDYYFVFTDIINEFLKTEKRHELYLMEPKTSNQILNTSIKIKSKWFDVGLKFADGTIYDLSDKNMSYNQMAKLIFDDVSIRPYISESFSVKCDSNKNIFSDLAKIEKIFNYCELNEIPVHPRFMDKYYYLRDS